MEECNMSDIHLKIIQRGVCTDLCQTDSDSFSGQTTGHLSLLSISTYCTPHRGSPHNNVHVCRVLGRYIDGPNVATKLQPSFRNVVNISIK